MKQYLDLLHRVMTEGADKTDRTGTGTKSVLGTKCGLTWRMDFRVLPRKATFTLDYLITMVFTGRYKY